MESRIKIAHEAPLSIFDEVQKLTDYDYCLVHLLEENKEYLNKFLESKEKGRRVILDNSIFELGEAFDMDRFAYWVDQLRPDEYIIPDSFDNLEQTISLFEKWENSYNHLPGKRIAVVQGESFEEKIECYKFLNRDSVDKIAISFGHPSYTRSILLDKQLSRALGRLNIFNHLIQKSLINEKKHHHLLGCSTPLEFLYLKNFNFIESLDTSHPVSLGIGYEEYNFGNLHTKRELVIAENINMEINNAQYLFIEKNIRNFRKILQ